MLVTGVIEIDAAGLVQRYTLDHRDKLPAGVARLIDSRVPLWRFEPVDLPEGQLSTVSAMSLRLVAHRMADDDYTVRLRSASFQPRQEDIVPTERLVITGMPRMDYPVDAISPAVSATAYVTLRIDRKGKVAEAVTRQVNLRMSGSETELDYWRGVFAREARRQAMRITFAVPTTGLDADREFWTGTLPIDYSMSKDMRGDVEGRWDAYIPGPVREIPWLRAASDPAVPAPDTATASRLQSSKEERRLRQPLDGS